MKKGIFIVLTMVLAAGCIKNDLKVNCDEVKLVAPAVEVDSLRAYIQRRNISAVEDPRGFFYRIENAGTGTKPSVCSNVVVNYIGKLSTDSVFDHGSNIQFPLSNVITGWQEGVPLIAKGGKIFLYLPPSLGYGSTANGPIPANSKLIFEIDLTVVN